MSFYKITRLFKINALVSSYLQFLKKIIVCFIFTFFTAHLFATELVSDSRVHLNNNQDLIASCDALNASTKHTNSSACIHYIRGFLAGAWGINNVKTSKIIIKNSGSTTWQERAYHQRVGKRGERFLPKKVTYYCSPDNDPETLIIELLTKNLSLPIKTLQALNLQIYDAIKTICPSDKIAEK